MKPCPQIDEEFQSDRGNYARDNPSCGAQLDRYRLQSANSAGKPVRIVEIVDRLGAGRLLCGGIDSTDCSTTTCKRAWTSAWRSRHQAYDPAIRLGNSDEVESLLKGGGLRISR